VLKVSQPRVLAVLVGSLLAICLLGAPALAQPPRSAPPAGGPQVRAEIALVDVQFIFKNYRVVKQYQTQLQAEQDQAEASLKQDLEKIQKLQVKLNDYRAGSKEYDDLDKQIVGFQADFNARRTVMRKEFLKEAAKIHCRIYQQIQDEVDAFANANGVVAVLQFNRETMDPEKPETVQAALGNPILWHRNLDISQYILQSLEQRSAPVTGNVNPGFPTNTRGVQR
jgi:Skp family chaperone for outer membrane proteins